MSNKIIHGGSRALTDRAIEVLKQISADPVPCQSVNFGIAGKFLQEGLIKEITRKNPETLTGRSRFYRITERGIATLAQAEERA